MYDFPNILLAAYVYSPCSSANTIKLLHAPEKAPEMGPPSQLKHSYICR